MSKSYDTANFYSEICFGDGAGVLQPGKSTGQIQITLTKYDNSAYNQLDDYSFNGDMTENGENKCITAYVNGNLAFGTEPGGAEPDVTVVPSVEPSESTEPVESITPSESTKPIESVEPSESNEPVESVKPSESTEPVESIIPSEDVEGVVPSVSLTTNANGSITQSCTITSVGSKPVELSKLAIRYYYSKAGDKKQNFWCDNAGLQLDVSPYYLNITSDVKGTFYKDYLEITFDSTESIPEGAGTLTMGIRFAQEDWSAYTDFIDNGYEVYYNGVKIAD